MSHRAQLMSIFGNTEQDLQANRSGLLGPDQRRRLARSIWANLAGTLVIVGGLLAILLFVAARPLVWYQYLLFGLFAIGGGAVGVYTVRGLRQAIRAGTVECLVGPIRVNLRGRNGWWLVVQGRDFRLPVQFWKVGNGSPYRVYVAPAAKRIVALEPEGWD
jgi:hypothetical protein